MQYIFSLLNQFQELEFEINEFFEENRVLGVDVYRSFKELSSLENVSSDTEFVIDNDHPITNVVFEILKIIDKNSVQIFTRLNLDTEFHVLFDGWEITREPL